VAKEIFRIHMPGPNQLDAGMDPVDVSARDLFAVPMGDITDDGLRLNVNVGIQYLEAWLGGNGCVPIYNLMEDAATAEISRAQVWQWVRHGAKLADGRTVDGALVRRIIDEELQRIETAAGPARFSGGNYRAAADLFRDMMTKPGLDEFLTIRAYDYIA
jgi:malate synthase